jgi:hypothetical protein
MLCVCTKITHRGEQDCHTDMDAEAEEVVGDGRETDHLGTFRHGKDQGGSTARVHAGHSVIGEVLIRHRSLDRRRPSQMTAKS